VLASVWQQSGRRGRGSVRLPRPRVPRNARHMDDGLAAKQRELDERAPIDLTKREAMILIASLHRYLKSIEQHAAADDYRTHTRESVAATRHTLGQLIWRLENAAAYPTKTSRYGADGMYRCTKEQWHADKKHVDDYGTVWVTEPSFKRLVDRRPR
jgi:hypothetical protein